MRTFKRFKTLAEIRKQCIALGLYLDASLCERGSDCIIIKSYPDKEHSTVLYNVTNGRFYGTNEHGMRFNSDSTKFENCPWFITLMEFFYA